MLIKSLIILVSIIFSLNVFSNNYLYQSGAFKLLKAKTVSPSVPIIPEPTPTIYDCFDPVNVGFIGEVGECQGKLIVDNITLRNIISAAGNYSDSSIWTGQVTDMSYIFGGKNPIFHNITGWNTSNVTTMEGLFRQKDFNQNISNWNVSKVTNMVRIFNFTTSFNQNLSTWCVINIASKPFEFDTSSAYTNSAIQPQWGTCP